MLQSRTDLEAELVQRIMTANNSTIFGSARITELIQQAEHWATTLHPWPSLSRARLTNSVNAQDSYDYPIDFLTDTISRVYVDNNRYLKKDFQDFRDYVDNALNPPTGGPDPTKRYFADYGRQFFLWPVPGTNGTNNIVAWGNIQSAGLPNPDFLTIFSQWSDMGNEAIVQKALSVALSRLESQIAGAAEQKAIALLGVLWKRVTDNLQKNQRLNHPFFAVPDLFGVGSGQSTIGNFNNSQDIIF